MNSDIAQNDAALLSAVQNNDKVTLNNLLAQPILFSSSIVFEVIKFLISNEKKLLLNILLQKLHPKYIEKPIEDNKEQTIEIIKSILDYKYLEFNKRHINDIFKKAILKKYIYLIGILLEVRGIEEEPLKEILKISLTSTNDIFILFLAYAGRTDCHSVINNLLITAVKSNNTDEKIAILLNEVCIENKYIIEVFLRCGKRYKNQALLILDKKKDDKEFLKEAVIESTKKDFADKIEFILKYYFNSEEQNDLSKIIFKIAFTNQSIKTLELILDKERNFPVDINCPNEENLTALMVATKYSNYSMTKLILKQEKVSVIIEYIPRAITLHNSLNKDLKPREKFKNFHYNRYSALYFASKNGDVNSLKMLLMKKQIDQNTLGMLERSLMFLMESRGYNETNKLILGIKYNLDKPYSTIKYSESFLKWAYDNRERDDNLEEFVRMEKIRSEIEIMFSLLKEACEVEYLKNVHKISDLPNSNYFNEEIICLVWEYLIGGLNVSNLHQVLTEFKRVKSLNNGNFYSLDYQKLSDFLSPFTHTDRGKLSDFLSSLTKEDCKKFSEFFSPLIQTCTPISVEDIFQNHSIPKNTNSNHSNLISRQNKKISKNIFKNM